MQNYLAVHILKDGRFLEVVVVVLDVVGSEPVMVDLAIVMVLGFVAY